MFVAGIITEKNYSENEILYREVDYTKKVTKEYDNNSGLINCYKKYNFPVENGIISFRNLNGGALKTKFQDKSSLVTTEKLENYKNGLER